MMQGSTNVKFSSKVYVLLLKAYNEREPRIYLFHRLYHSRIKSQYVREISRE